MVDSKQLLIQLRKVRSVFQVSRHSYLLHHPESGYR